MMHNSGKYHFEKELDLTVFLITTKVLFYADQKMYNRMIVLYNVQSTYPVTFFAFCIAESICCAGGQSDCDIIGVRQLKQESAATGKNKKSSQESSKHDKNKQNTVDVKSWKPLLLVIPLRLGLTEINSVYVQSLKVYFCNYLFPMHVNV